MRIISFYSPTSGGSTTTLLNVAAELSIAGKKVGILDLNAMNPSIHRSALFTGHTNAGGCFIGLCDSFPTEEEMIAFPSGPKARRAYARAIQPYMAYRSRTFPKMRVIPMALPKGSGPSNARPLIQWFEAYQRSDRSMKLILAVLLVVFEKAGLDVLLVDSESGFTDGRGPTICDLPDTVVVVSGVEENAVDGTKETIRLIKGLNDESRKGVNKRRQPGRDQAMISVVLAAARMPEHPKRDATLARTGEKIGRPFDLVIPYVPEIPLGGGEQVVSSWITDPSDPRRAPFVRLSETILRNDLYEP